jgi:hypothetical protein
MRYPTRLECRGSEEKVRTRTSCVAFERLKFWYAKPYPRLLCQKGNMYIAGIADLYTNKVVDSAVLYLSLFQFLGCLFFKHSSVPPSRTNMSVIAHI